MSTEESAFGRPAKWSTALPSVLAGALACAIALYGRFLLPAQLPERYAAHLQQSAEEYAALGNVSGMFGSSKLLAAAGQRDVIFERLVSLEKGSPERYWEWAQFLIEHAELLRARLDDPASSIQNELRNQFVEQANAFDAKAAEILEQLAVGNSQLRDVAVLTSSVREYEAAMVRFGVLDATALATRLRPVATADSSPLSAQQLAEAKLLLVTLTVEAAWQQQPGSQLSDDPELLQQAAGLLGEFEEQGVNNIRPLEWAALRRVVQLYNGTVDETVAAEANSGLGSASRLSRQNDWRTQLAELQLALCAGKWEDLEYRLPNPTDRQSAPIGLALARTVCRLLCSQAAQRDPAWAQQRFQAIRLIGPWAAQVPEWSELLWESARGLAIPSEALPTDATQSETDAAKPIVPLHVAQQLVSSGDPLLEQSLEVLSGAIHGNQQIVSDGLTQLRATPGGTFLVSRVVLWRAQTAAAEELEAMAEPLGMLQQAVVASEPNNALGWFALGILEFRLGHFDDAEPAFVKASELTPGAPAIKDALNAVKAARNAQRIPANGTRN